MKKLIIALYFLPCVAHSQVSSIRDWQSVRVYFSDQIDSVKSYKRIISRTFPVESTCNKWENDAFAIERVKKCAAIAGYDAVLVTACIESGGIRKADLNITFYTNPNKKQATLEEFNKVTGGSVKLKVLESHKQDGLIISTEPVSTAKIKSVVNEDGNIVIKINIPQTWADTYRVTYITENRISIYSSDTKEAFVLEPVL